ncbi:MAG: hypothetical protein FD163_239 [Hyphomonadaceae bacterium]|nr:MAG: hypothetical protein FD128_187 [Hyphomonadaceae bacterium]KAF0186964.1 MAG: hypothetical protein FD163_239 [Hyphomonadaceae bacterium]
MVILFRHFIPHLQMLSNAINFDKVTIFLKKLKLAGIFILDTVKTSNIAASLRGWINFVYYRLLVELDSLANAMHEQQIEYCLEEIAWEWP